MDLVCVTWSLNIYSSLDIVLTSHWYCCIIVYEVCTIGESAVRTNPFHNNLELGDMTLRPSYPGITSRKTHTVTLKQQNNTGPHILFMHSRNPGHNRKLLPLCRPPIVNIKGGTFWSLDHSSELHHGCGYVVSVYSQPALVALVWSKQYFILDKALRLINNLSIMYKRRLCIIEDYVFTYVERFAWLAIIP
jgi:hypothetical protein